MRFTLVTSFCSLALALSSFAQDPTATAGTPAATIASTPTPASTLPATAAPVASASRSRSHDDDDLADDIDRKVKKGLQITIGDHGTKTHHHSGDTGIDSDDAAWMAVPIVGIIFSTLFGTPVLIVAVILFFSYWKQRSLHRTVRMMVEKGQPVPEGLFVAPHSPAKQRSDMRRGVVLVMVGIGLMVFLAAVNDWEGGAWALGLIPFLMGAGYLVIWKFEGGKQSTDNTPHVS